MTLQGICHFWLLWAQGCFWKLDTFCPNKHAYRNLTHAIDLTTPPIWIGHTASENWSWATSTNREGKSKFPPSSLSVRERRRKKKKKKTKKHSFLRNCRGIRHAASSTRDVPFLSPECIFVQEGGQNPLIFHQAWPSLPRAVGSAELWHWATVSWCTWI